MVTANKASSELKKPGFGSMKHVIALFVALKKKRLDRAKKVIFFKVVLGYIN